MSMEESIIQPSGSGDGAFELGEVLGGRRVFSAIAGRCSAADADCLRRIRDNRMYRAKSDTWEEFCPKYLGMSKTNANRIIRLLEEFGPDYFEMAQLTRITPDQYRAIAPAVRDHALTRNGEAIALIPENAEKIATAVADLRNAAKPEPELKPEGGETAGRQRPRSRRARIKQLRKTGRELAEDFADLARTRPAGGDSSALEALRHAILSEVYQVDLSS